MLGGFGAIRAMQDSLKMNREQNKRHRKTAKELAESYPAKTSAQKTQIVSDPKKVALVREYILAKRKREKRRNAILLAVLVMIGITLLAMLFI